jgi:hypothetical protein
MAKEKRAIVLGFTDTESPAALTGYGISPIYVSIRCISSNYARDNEFSILVESEEEFLCPDTQSHTPPFDWLCFPRKKIKIPYDTNIERYLESFGLFLRVLAKQNRCEIDISGLIRGYTSKCNNNISLNKRLEKIVEIAKHG